MPLVVALGETDLHPELHVVHLIHERCHRRREILMEVDHTLVTVLKYPRTPY